ELCGRFPWVAFHHGYTHTDLKMRAYNKLDRWSLPRANRVITVSEAFAAQLQRMGVKPERLRVVHNSVRAEEFRGASIQAGRISPGIMPGERVILAVGRLSREKGHAVLIRAFSGLLRHDHRLRAKLVLVGDGPERRRLQRAAVSFGVEDCVVFTGQVGDVRPYYKAADVLVLPSYTEGSPNVLLEAMAAGLPVVATAVGGVPEIVTDGESALLTPPGDSQRMAAAMSALLNDAY